MAQVKPVRQDNHNIPETIQLTEEKGQSIEIDDFKWKIIVPNYFERIDQHKWDEDVNKAKDSVEKRTNTKIIRKSKTLFAFQSGKNKFASFSQHSGKASDSAYSYNLRRLYKGLYEVYTKTLPGTKIDTVSGISLIGGLAFQMFTVTINLDSGKTVSAQRYSRLFDDEELIIEAHIGAEDFKATVENALRNSIFTQ